MKTYAQDIINKQISEIHKEHDRFIRKKLKENNITLFQAICDPAIELILKQYDYKDIGIKIYNKTYWLSEEKKIN